MISTAAVLPVPPLLVPELGGRAATETAALRAACVEAGRALAGAARRWIAVGAGTAASHHGPDSCGTFAGFGVDVRVALGPDAAARVPDPLLPLPLLVAGWVRAAVGDDAVRIEGRVLPTGTDPAVALALGADLAGGGPADEPVGLLVLGDGAATHSARAPGTLDARAAGFEHGVVAALRDGDARALAALAPTLCEQLWVGGRVPWQVLAGALPAPARAELLHSSTPFGVAYHVALWHRG